MKTTFVKGTTIKINYKDHKFIVTYKDGYAIIDKYKKKDFIGNWTVYKNGKYTLNANYGDYDPVLDATIKYGTIANLNDPAVVDAIMNTNKGGK